METMSLEHLDSSTGITCRTFYERLCKCYYYKENNRYARNIELLFHRILKGYQTGESIFSIFSRMFSSRAYTGKNYITPEDRESFRVSCLRCAINLDKLLEAKARLFIEQYCYKWKVKGEIHGKIDHRNRVLNISLSFDNTTVTNKELDYFCLNNSFYNITNNFNNDLLVMSVPQNGFYFIPYDPKDYTIQRGFLTVSKGNKIRKRGEHCNSCANNCKPNYFKGLERVTLTCP